MKELRCGCPGRNNLLAKYDDYEIQIKCKDGKIVVLQVIDGKLVRKEDAANLRQI